MARPTATENEILEAARQANALEFIDRFPERLDTIVGETRELSFQADSGRGLPLQGRF